MNVFGRAIAVLPQSLTGPIAAGLGSVAAVCVRRRRDIVLENLKRAFGDGMDAAERERLYRANYQNLVMNGIEMCYQRYGPLNWKDGRIVEVEGFEHFQRLLDKNQQFLTVTAHFGNWELMGIWVQEKFPLSSLAKGLHNELLQRELAEMRGRHGLEIVWSERETAARDALKLIRSGKAVNFLIDQDMRLDGIFVDYFGIPSSTNPTPATFSLKFGLPIVPAFLVRLGPTRHKFIVLPPIFPEEAVGETRDEKIRDITQKATKAIEDIVRLYPAQYFWFHRRWKTSPKKLTGKNRDKREKRRLFRTAGELDPKDEKRPG